MEVSVTSLCSHQWYRETLWSQDRSFSLLFNCIFCFILSTGKKMWCIYISTATFCLSCSPYTHHERSVCKNYSFLPPFTLQRTVQSYKEEARGGITAVRTSTPLLPLTRTYSWSAMAQIDSWLIFSSSFAPPLVTPPSRRCTWRTRGVAALLQNTNTFATRLGHHMITWKILILPSLDSDKHFLRTHRVCF